MPSYSENQVRILYEEFKKLKKYPEKLFFFDRHFGIIPFSFPDFDPRLLYFFEDDKTKELAGIFKKERNNPELTEKRFSFGETFVFSIRPANSNSAAFSSYILTSFLERSPVFEEWIERNITKENPIENLLNQANGTINYIESCLQNDLIKSFSQQCMSVFYKGFYDAFSNRVNLPGKKRKFTELYLYAQGIIYENYIRSLKTAWHDSLNPVDMQRPVRLDLPGKLELLQELGIIDFLKSRYAGPDSHLSENKMAEMLCQIIGENPENKETVTRILSSGKKLHTNGFSIHPPNAIHDKIRLLVNGK